MTTFPYTPIGHEASGPGGHKSDPAQIRATTPQFGSANSGAMEHPQQMSLTVEAASVLTEVWSGSNPAKALPREDSADPA